MRSERKGYPNIERQLVGKATRVTPKTTGTPPHIVLQLACSWFLFQEDGTSLHRIQCNQYSPHQRTLPGSIIAIHE